MSNLKRLLAAILAMGGICLLFGQEVVEAIVAVVNDEIITLSDYKRQHDLLYQQLRAQSQGEDFEPQFEAFKKRLLDDMIVGILLLQRAKEMDIDVTEQLNMYIDSIKEENGFESEGQLRAAFQQQGVNFERWRQETRDRLLRDSVIYTEVGRGIVIDDGEIFTYYRQNPEEFTQPPEFRIKGIFVSAEGRGEDETRERRKEIVAKLDMGEDFAAVAAEYSEGPEKDNQGDMGSYKEGELLGDFEKELKKMEAGQITPWIRIETGWYLLRLEEKTESRLLEFDEVRDEIQEKIYMERSEAGRQEYLEELKEKSFIKILIPDPLKHIGRP